VRLVISYRTCLCTLEIHSIFSVEEQLLTNQNMKSEWIKAIKLLIESNQSFAEFSGIIFVIFNLSLASAFRENPCAGLPNGGNGTYSYNWPLITGNRNQLFIYFSFFIAGLVNDYSSCPAYYSCVNNIPFELRCSYPFYFVETGPGEGRCEWPENVECRRCPVAGAVNVIFHNLMKISSNNNIFFCRFVIHTHAQSTRNA
jgi:hypothetical protein